MYGKQVSLYKATITAVSDSEIANAFNNKALVTDYFNFILPTGTNTDWNAHLKQELVVSTSGLSNATMAALDTYLPNWQQTQFFYNNDDYNLSWLDTYYIPLFPRGLEVNRGEVYFLWDNETNYVYFVAGRPSGSPTLTDGWYNRSNGYRYGTNSNAAWNVWGVGAHRVSGYFAFYNPSTQYIYVAGNYGTDDALVTASSNISSLDNVYGDFFTNASADYTPVAPPTDPYNDLPIGGDQPLPGSGFVGIPGFPGLTATSAGVIGLFAPTAAQMQLLADFMWTDFGGTGTTVEDILQEIVEALKRSISNPLDYIIGLNIIPSQGLSIGASKNVRFGFVSSGVSMPVLANQYFTVDCGSLAFDTVCGDTFLDYAPYSKFSIYLPYIGFKDVDPNDFVGHTIGVIYHGDCVTGGVTAYVTKDGSVMYQYSGCCALNVPLSADNWGETISAAINVATGIVAAAASGGAAGVATAAAKGAASVAANPSLLSPQVSHSGAVSGGAGCMGVQYPFVIREAVNFHTTLGFNKSTGYPAYYYKKLADVSGFTTVIEAHMSNIPMATQDEIQEIESLLEGGVIL